MECLLGAGFEQTKLSATTCYQKINGTMYYLVPNNVYICVIKVTES